MHFKARSEWLSPYQFHFWTVGRFDMPNGVLDVKQLRKAGISEDK
jgi:hypothetical protein